MVQNPSEKLDSSSATIEPPPIPDEPSMEAEINLARAKKSLNDKQYREELIRRTSIRNGKNIFNAKGERLDNYGGSTLGKIGGTIGKTLGGLVGRGVAATANQQVNRELNQSLRGAPPPPPLPTATPDETTQANSLNLKQSQEKNNKPTEVTAAKDLGEELLKKEAKKIAVSALASPATWVTILIIVTGLAIALLLSIIGLIVVADYQCLQQKNALSKGFSILNEYWNPGSLLRDWGAGKCAVNASGAKPPATTDAAAQTAPAESAAPEVTNPVPIK